MDCCDNKNVIFTDYYVCVNCGVIHDYKYIHDISIYENENNSNKNFISKSFYKRINYLNKKLYWITDRSIIIFLNEGLEEIKKLIIIIEFHLINMLIQYINTIVINQI